MLVMFFHVLLSKRQWIKKEKELCAETIFEVNTVSTALKKIVHLNPLKRALFAQHSDSAFRVFVVCWQGGSRLGVNNFFIHLWLFHMIFVCCLESARSGEENIIACTLVLKWNLFSCSHVPSQIPFFSLISNEIDSNETPLAHLIWHKEVDKFIFILAEVKQPQSGGTERSILCRLMLKNEIKKS